MTKKKKAYDLAINGQEVINANPVGTVINYAEMAAHYAPEEYALAEEEPKAKPADQQADDVAGNPFMFVNAGASDETMARFMEALEEVLHERSAGPAAQQVEIPCGEQEEDGFRFTEDLLDLNGVGDDDAEEEVLSDEDAEFLLEELLDYTLEHNEDLIPEREGVWKLLDDNKEKILAAAKTGQSLDLEYNGGIIHLCADPEEAVEPAQQEKGMTFNAKVKVLPDGTIILKPTKRWRKKMAKRYPHKIKGRVWALDDKTGTIKFQPYQTPEAAGRKPVLKTTICGLEVQKKPNGDVSFTYNVSEGDLNYPMLLGERLRHLSTTVDIYIEPLCHSLAEANNLAEFNKLYDANTIPFQKALEALGEDPYEDKNDPMAMLKMQGALGARVKAHLLEKGTHPYVHTFNIKGGVNANA